MRLGTQDQLTAIGRFFDDVWRATRDRLGTRGSERIRRAFGLWADAPSQATWEDLERTLRDLVGEANAIKFLAEVEPYLGRIPDVDPDAAPAAGTHSVE
jgi:hypothetical protein